MRTITAPGIEWKEIDKSAYSPAMTGTACYITFFSNKGEPYKPMEFTSRSAFEKYYGAPDNEAERYGYAAACEVINQNGRLWCARLPYDNAAFEKVVGVKYKLFQKKNYDDLVLSGGRWHAVNEADPEIDNAYVIEGGKIPILYDLSSIDEYRTDEAKVPPDTFLIVDTTNATYGKVMEDTRKGQKREVIGIVPVVTTAANAMYAQSLISLPADQRLCAIRNYESLRGSNALTLRAVSSDGQVITIDKVQMENAGLSESDLVNRFSTENYYSMISTATELKSQIIEVLDGTLYDSQEDAQKAFENKNQNDELSDYVVAPLDEAYSITGYMREVSHWCVNFTKLTSFESTPSADAAFENFTKQQNEPKFWYTCKKDAETVGMAIAEAALETPCIASLFNGAVSAEVVAHKKDWVIKYFKEHPELSDYSISNWITDEEFKLGGYRKFEDGFGNNKEKMQEALNTKYIGNDDYLSVESCVYNVYGESSGKYGICTVKNVLEKKELDPSDPRYGWHNKDFNDEVPTTMALDAANYFSTIQPAADGGFNPDHLKDIGVVVYRCYLDPSEGNKISWEAVEAYAGSLCKEDKDPNTGVSKFIDTIVNTNSQYINFFSNCFASKTAKKFYKDECDILLAEPSIPACLGLYSPMTKEDISITKSIYDGLNKAFQKVENLDLLDIDIVCDAGISNIASYLKAVFGNKGQYDLSITDDLGNPMIGMWKCQKYTDSSVKTWKTVVQKLDNFCKNVRKDCMFITECPRPLVLQGQKKIVRDSKPANTIDANILPYLPAVCGLNTNFGAGYLDWFEVADDYSGDFFWCPPSIKAMGVYINTDVNFEYWDAPAGLNRGVIAATDVAFSPTVKQAGPMYEKSWNYAVKYPLDGIVLEGQKTFQTKPSALDRVNVRRLFLRLERAVYKVARYFKYEGNTAYTRQRLVDAINPYFKDAKNRGGIYDYKIVCDENINDPDTIDRNEMVCKIGIKPVKTAEFLMFDFICLKTGASWSEAF